MTGRDSVSDARAVRGTTGADLLVRSLIDQGIHTVYINPGTDTAPFAHAMSLRSRRATRLRGSCSARMRRSHSRRRTRISL